MKNLNELTNNVEVVEYVRDFLLNQGKKSMSMPNSNNDTKCAYRGEKNSKCAIGCIIDDKFYSPYFEGNRAVDANMNVNKEIFEALQKSTPNWKIDLNVIDTMQTIHDRYEVDLWDSQFNALISNERERNENA